VFYADWHTGTISGVTYGGVALSVVPGSTNSFSYNNLESIQYYLPNPPLGAHAVVVNANYGVGIIGISVSLNGTNGSIRNVLYDAEYGNSADPSGGGGAYQFAAQAGDALVTFLAYNGSGTPTPGVGQTLITENAIGTSYGAASSYMVAASTVELVYSFLGIPGTGYIATGVLFEAGVQISGIRKCPPGLLTSPTRCSAVLIQRADGLQFGLSDATVPFIYDGLTYQVVQGADASNVHQESGTPVGDMEVRTILNDALDYVTSTDVRGTRYNNSWWTLFLIDYMNPGNGIMIMGKYRLSKYSNTDSSQKFQLKGLLSILSQATGRTYSANCDVMRFGDKRCDPGRTIRASMSISCTVLSCGVVDGLFTVDFSGSTKPAGYFSFGDATFTSGANNGLEAQIKTHSVLTPAAWSGVATYGLGDYSTYGGDTWISLRTGNTGNAPGVLAGWWQMVTGNPATVARIGWRTPAPYSVSVGDVATLCFGCDRRKATCQDVPNTENPSSTNIENFHGFYLPSPDQILTVGRLM